MGAMNSASALSTSSSRHHVISTRNGCSAYSQQSKSFESFVRGNLQPRCHASNEATSVKHSVAKIGVTRVLEQQLKQRQSKHSKPTSLEFLLGQNCRNWTARHMRLRENHYVSRRGLQIIESTRQRSQTAALSEARPARL